MILSNLLNSLKTFAATQISILFFVNTLTLLICFHPRRSVCSKLLNRGYVQALALTVAIGHKEVNNISALSFLFLVCSIA